MFLTKMFLCNKPKLKGKKLLKLIKRERLKDTKIQSINTKTQLALKKKIWKKLKLTLQMKELCISHMD